MGIFAWIEGGKVSNTVICDNQELADTLWPTIISIDITNITPQPSIGWRYVTGSFAPPSIVEPISP